MFYTIYWVCIQGLCDQSYTSMFKYYFSNTWTGLGCSGVSLCSLGMKIELFPYIHPPFKIAMSWSNRLRMKNVVELCVPDVSGVRLANSKAGIKPTAPLSAFDKENSIEFLLDFLHYLYNYYIVCALFSHAYHVMWCCDFLSCDPDYVTLVTWHFSTLPSV